MAIPARFYGFNPPFIGGVQNIMSRQVDERLIKNDILQLIMTLPGERVHRPNFGTGLRAIVFDTVNESELQALSSDIKLAIETYDDRVKVDNVTAVSDDEGQSVKVRVNVSLINQPLVKYFVELAFNQSGSVTISR